MTAQKKEEKIVRFMESPAYFQKKLRHALEDAPRRQHGLTKPHYSNGLENGFTASSSSSKSKENGVNRSFERNNASRDSPTNSTVNLKTNASSKWVAPQFLHDITDRNELIFRRVRGILNKITPERFDKLSYDLINIGIDKTVLKGIIILIYEKAIDEPKYCNLYGQLCLRLHRDVPNFDDAPKSSNTFLRLLLSKCQEEFETRSKASSAFDKKDGPLSPEEKLAKQVAKRKMLGNIKFIGELGKLELLQEAILHKCIQQLLAKKKRTSLPEMAEDIECMCQIMSTIGKRLDTSKAMNIMTQYFDRIEMLSKSDELPSRIRFMLRDVIELRRHNWMPRRIQMENGPRSVTQMRWESMGPMMPLPFSFFPPGMPIPPEMQAAMNAGMPPFGAGDMTMPWFNDSVLAAGGITQSTMDGKLPADYHDENKDIFGKPVNKGNSGPSQKPSTNFRAPAKPDLFEPHYMKSKSGNKGMLNGRNGSGVKNGFGGQHSSNQGNKDKDKKVFNKNNPWNIDPLLPHFSKPSINLIAQSEEANKIEIQSKTSTPPMRVSPPTVPRLSSTNIYNKQQQQQQQQAWKKGAGEVSLRPASFLTKKEEKPKSGLMKPDELPAKMQQFTNLTINDKTNKSKKTALSKADVDKKILEVTTQYKETKDMSQACSDLQTLATNLKYSRMVAKQLLIFAAAQNEDDWTHMADICFECINKSLFSSHTLINAYSQLLDDIKIMESGNGKEFMAMIAARLIVKDLSKFSSLVENFQDGNHYPTAMICLSHLNKTNGKDWLRNMLNKEKIELKMIFPKYERSDDAIMKVAQEMDMAFLFPHLCLKEELLKLLEAEKDEDFLTQWMKFNEGILSRKLLVHLIVTCAVAMATKETSSGVDSTQKPEKELQEKEKDVLGKLNNFLKTFVGNEFKDQLEAIYALQVFCSEKEFPKEMLLRLFLCFYNMEIIEEDVFLKWKEDLNDSYPGKGKSLFQVNSWLQWLETADEEEEEDDGDDED